MVCGRDSNPRYITLGVLTVYAGHKLAAGFRVALGAVFPSKTLQIAKCTAHLPSRGLKDGLR